MMVLWLTSVPRATITPPVDNFKTQCVPRVFVVCITHQTAHSVTRSGVGFLRPRVACSWAMPATDMEVRSLTSNLCPQAWEQRYCVVKVLDFPLAVYPALLDVLTHDTLSPLCQCKIAGYTLGLLPAYVRTLSKMPPGQTLVD